MTGTRRERFEGLYRDHHPAVRAYLLRRADPELAQDALSETFLAAWRRFDELPAEPLLMLVAWEGLDPVGAAKVAGCSRATFAVRLHRARKRLDRALYALEFPLATRDYDALEIR